MIAQSIRIKNTQVRAALITQSVTVLNCRINAIRMKPGDTSTAVLRISFRCTVDSIGGLIPRSSKRK